MAEESKVPTKEEIISFLKEQIEVKSLQLDLQQINTSLASARAEELKALAFIGQMTQLDGEKPQGVPHNLTQEDLDANPELVEAGMKVGDEVIIPASEAPKKLKKK